jgi:hypothetical protein
MGASLRGHRRIRTLTRSGDTLNKLTVTALRGLVDGVSCLSQSSGARHQSVPTVLLNRRYSTVRDLHILSCETRSGSGCLVQAGSVLPTNRQRVGKVSLSPSMIPNAVIGRTANTGLSPRKIEESYFAR